MFIIVHHMQLIMDVYLLISAYQFQTGLCVHAITELLLCLRLALKDHIYDIYP